MAGTIPASSAKAKGAVITATEPSSPGNVSVVEVQAGGNGIFVWLIAPGEDGSASHRVAIESASRINSGPSVVTPLFKYGIGDLQSVIRRGVDTAGSPPDEGAWHMSWSNFGTLQGAFPGVYLEPGQVLTVTANAVATAVTAVIGFTELP